MKEVMLFRRRIVTELLLVTEETSFTRNLHLHSKLAENWINASYGQAEVSFKNIDGFPRCLINNEVDGESIGSSHCLKNTSSVW